jgi:hypothetical protein
MPFLWTGALPRTHAQTATCGDEATCTDLALTPCVRAGGDLGAEALLLRHLCDGGTGGCCGGGAGCDCSVTAAAAVTATAPAMAAAAAVNAVPWKLQRRRRVEKHDHHRSSQQRVVSR